MNPRWPHRTPAQPHRDLGLSDGWRPEGPPRQTVCGPLTHRAQARAGGAPALHVHVGAPAAGALRGCGVSRWSRELPVVPRLTCRCSDTPRPLADRGTSGTSGQVGLAGTWPVGGVGWAEQSQAGSGARTLRSLRRDETAGRLTYRNGSRASAGRERVRAAGELRVLALPGNTTPGEEPAQSFSPFPALKSWGAGAMATQRKRARPRPRLFCPSRCS